MDEKKIIINSLEEMKNMRKYWENRFEINVDNMKFPTDFHREDVNERKIIIQEVNSELCNKLIKITRNDNLAIYVLMLTILNIEMLIYNNRNNLMVGSPVYIEKEEEIITNKTLPLITLLNNDMSFKEALLSVKKIVLEAYENQIYPIKEILNDNDIKNITDVLPINCAMKKFHTEKKIKEILDCEKNEITFFIERSDNSIFLELNYNSKLFKEDTINRIKKCYINIMEQTLNNLDVKICEIELLTEKEKNKILYEFNNTYAEYPKDKTIQELFEKQVEKAPDSIAVIFGDKKLTYRELNQKANILAMELRNKGVKADSIVGIMVERSLEMIIGIMGILKSGGAYLPIDPSYPKERIQYMLKDSKSTILLSKEDFLYDIEFNGDIIDLFKEALFKGKVSNLEKINNSSNLAYVIYTSGTTGNPKGVMIEHKALVNRINWMQKKYPLSNYDVILQKTTYTFDVSVWEILWWSLVGAKVCMLAPNDEKDPIKIIEAIKIYNITTIHFVPSMLDVFLYALEENNKINNLFSLKRMFCSGEALNFKQVSKFYKELGSSTELINLYGPTEAAIDVSYFKCNSRGEKIIPIGRPIDNIKLYILNNNNKLTPIGVPGELYISGDGLARGYLNKQELTNEKFVENPFEAGRKMYRTGDLVRWMPDGNIEFLGRIDNQVKIRGFRIETGEIENALIKHPDIKNAVVLASEDNKGEKYLTAYIETDRINFETINGKKRYMLPNNMAILDINKNETDFMYKEIFEEKNYLKHGIKVNDNDYILDIGANIGMFSLFINKVAENVKIFSFEPIPDLFEILDMNTQLYNNNTKVFNCGISNENSEAQFSFYPKASIMSGKYGDVNVEKEIYRENLRNIVKEKESEFGDKKYYDELVEDRLQVKNVTCKLKTLSSIIKENNIERIDLLKIDVEKSELDVLNGIEEYDWNKIKQIVLEVHDINGQLDKVVAMLKNHNYYVEIEAESVFDNTGIYIVYASINKNSIGNNDMNLSNFIGSVDNNIITRNELIQFLDKFLPKYMIPEQFVQLEKIPLTHNGKVDRKALSSFKENISITAEYEAPRNEVEEVLSSIWGEVLGVEKVGINDNFFELGGHSLKATILMSKIHKELNKEVPLKELFESPTIKELSKYIESAKENIYSRIEKIEERECYDTSSAQKRMYMLQQFDKDNTVYNMPVFFELEGEVDKDKIEKTFRKLTQRHEALRSYFETLDGEIIQKIQKNTEFALNNKNGSIEERINNFVRPFDLEKVPLFRVELVEDKEKTYLLIDMHHIISDGLSMGILINEFTAIYGGKTLEVLKLQYKDFAAWQNQFLNSEDLKRQENYWINSLSGEIPVLNLPYDYERPSFQNFEGDNICFNLDIESSSALKIIMKQTKTTSHMILLSAFSILLSKYSEQEDILIGTPVAGRSHDDLQNIMGMFVNTLVLRNKPEGNKSYIEFLKEVKDNALLAYDNQGYQFERLIEKLVVRRDSSRNPLFDVMFNMIDTITVSDLKLDNLLLKKHDNGSKISKFDLTLNVLEQDNIFKFNIEYCVKLFNRETIERMARNYITILKNIIKNINVKICDLALLTEMETNQILYEFNNTKREFPSTKTINELFEEQVEKTPDRISVIYEDQQLTYRQLNEKSNQLARVLRKKGVRPDSIVGIIAERSLEMVIGIMGILKAGGAYLPIDYKFPKDRIKYILEDSGTKVLLIGTKKIDESELDYTGCSINLNDTESYDIDKSNVEKNSSENNLAYVIYTSGSTGNPKGVLIQHNSLINRIIWMDKNYPINEKDTILQKTTYTFDVSVWELIWAITVGAKLAMLRPEGEKDVREIIRAIEKYKVTTMHFVPSMLDIFLEYVANNECKLESLRQIFSSGEALKGNQVSKFYEIIGNSSLCNLINLYGPTEAAIDVTYYNCCHKDDNKVPIGKPIDNISLYILGKNNDLKPIGVKGELCISGVGVARGYLNNEKLTKLKFVENPFEKGMVMYKTGDIAKWKSDGNIECLGRIDDQVKIRGFRIELGEIESVLLKNKEIKEAVVIDKENSNGNKYICAYIVSNKLLSLSELRNSLAKKIPDYMIPAQFIELEYIPLTNNGKVDKKTLYYMEGNLINGAEFEKPSNEIEEKLSKVWQEVLEVKQVGINDKFFELGGDSIKAIQIVSRAKKYGYVLDVKELLRNLNIREISKLIRLNEEDKTDGIVEGFLELTPIQKWFFNNNFVDEHHWNQSITILKRDGFEKEILESAFIELLTHHDSLRMVFKKENGKVLQINNGIDNINVNIDSYNLVDSINIDKDMNVIGNRIQSGINLERGPLYKLALFKTTQGDYLSIIIHHLVIDGVSWRILLEDLDGVYKQLKSGQKVDFLGKTTSYKKWSENLVEYSSSKAILGEIDYWKSVEDKSISTIFKNNKFKNIKLKNTKTESFELTEKETRDLIIDTNNAYMTVANDILLTAIALSVKEWINIDNVLIELEGHGREEIAKNIDTTRTIGWFTSKYPIVLNMDKSDDIAYSIKSVKETLRHIPNKGIGYGILKWIGKESVKDKLKFNLEPEICFNYLGKVDKIFNGALFEIADKTIGENISLNNKNLHALTITCIIIEDRMRVYIQYNNYEFNEENIKNLLNILNRKIIEIIKHCKSKDNIEFTPTDLGDDDLDLDELDYISNIIDSNIDYFE